MTLSRITSVVPDGGHGDPAAYRDLHNRLSLTRESARCMYPGEFLSTLYRFLHPRHVAVGVESNRWGRYVREQVGLPGSRFGTIWVCGASTPREMLFMVSDCLPYASVRPKRWNEEKNQYEDVAAMDKGWRSALHDLAVAGHLRPAARLSWLIGEDSAALARQGGWWR